MRAVVEQGNCIAREITIFSSRLVLHISRVLLIVALVCVASLLTHAAPASSAGLITEDPPVALSLTDEERAWLKANPVLRVAALAKWEPIDSWASGGVYSGISGDYLELLAKRLGIRIEATPYPSFDAVLAAGREGRADVMPSIAITAEREAYLAFTQPYLDRPMALFLNRNAGTVDLTGDWKNLRVAAERGFAVVGEIKKRKPLAKLTQYDDTPAALTALAKGEADVYVGGLQPGSVAAEALLLSNIVVSGYFESPLRALHLAVPKEKTKLRSILIAAMRSITREETDAIDARWSPAHTILNYAAGTVPLTEEQRAWLTTNNRIRVGYDPEMSPISFQGDGGRLTGLAHDTLKLVTQKLGISVVEERKGNWADILAAARRGEIDVLIAAGKNQDRLGYLNYAGPYLSSPTSLVDRGETRDLLQIGDLIGKRLAVQDEHFLIPEISRRYPGIRLVKFPDLKTALAAVEKKDCDAAMGNLHSVAHLISTEFIGELRIGGNVESGESVLYFATPRNNAMLANVLDAALGTISQSENIELRNRWLKATYKPGFSLKEVLFWVLPIVTALLGALLVFVWLNRKLKDGISRRNAIVLELATKRTEAVAATQAKARFLAAMSHEIRTPMQGILGAADMLTKATLPPQQSRLANIVREAAQNLVQMMNEVLDDRKLEEGHVEARLAPADLVHSVRGAVDLFTPSAEAKDIKLTFDTDGSVAPRYMADGTFVRQIVTNLVSNALKFTGKGEVAVSMSAVAGGDEAAHGDNAAHSGAADVHALSIKVTDSGRGMSKDELKRLFEPYVQGEAGRTADVPGTGLGLSISLRLAKAMGGDIVAESEPGNGTSMTLVLELPVAEAVTVLTTTGLNHAIDANAPMERAVVVPATGLTRPSQHSGVITTRTEGARARVLANEDDPLVQALMHDQFAELGVNADIAQNAELGFAQWSNGDYDLIFTDNSLGGMSGLEFTTAVRSAEQRSGRSRTPIVGITGSIMAGEIEYCRRAGMDRILQKPVVLADLRAAIDDFVPQAATVDSSK
jgi:two-component system, NarL family, sensor histidine kinase EvgS